MPGQHSAKQKRRAKHIADSERRRGKSPEEAERIGWATVNARKGGGFQLMSLDDYYDLVKDQTGREGWTPSKYHEDAAKRRASDPTRTAHVDRPPPAVSDVSSRLQNERRVTKFPRRPKPTVRMKPISDEEAMAHIRTGTYNPNRQKSLRWLAALKALATGYSKVSGGGALRAPNRSYPLDLELGVDDLNRAMEAMPSPSGPAKPPSTYLPGVHNPKSPVRRAPGLKKPGAAKKTYPTITASMRPSTSSSGSPRVLDSGGATELSNSLDNVVLKSGGDMPTNFNDLFKSELGTTNDDHLVDCPHCEAPITKSDLEKAYKGRGKTTHLSGPKHGKSSAHVRDHNPEGGTMRGGDGHGVHTPSRGVPGAKKHDEVHVQSTSKHRGKLPGVSKADGASRSDDSSSGDAGSGDIMSKSEHRVDAVAATVKKSFVTFRGTPHVQWVDDGSDAALAKSISEGALGGTPPTQPLDLNNDMSRLLV